MVTHTQAIVLRIFNSICICSMVYVIFWKGFWLILGSLALDRGPIPRAYLIEAFLFVAFIISTCLFWWKPWLAAVISWFDLIAILLRINPWNNNLLSTFFDQFFYDHIFFFAANLGLVAFLLMKRRSRAETA